MKRISFILLPVIAIAWTVFELCPAWFSARLPQNCQRVLCPRAQIEQPSKYGFVPIFEHNTYVELKFSLGGFQLSFVPQKPALKRIAFTSLVFGIALLGLFIPKLRWLRIAVRVAGVLALLLAVTVIALMIQVISL
jgi:hypothetical protein